MAEAFLFQLLSGAVSGKRWNKTISGGGITISHYHFLPFQQVLEVLMVNRHFPCTAAAAQASVERGTPLYAQTGILTRSRCGRFWEELLPGCAEDPDALEALLNAMAWGYALFHGDIQEDDYAAGLSEALLFHRKSWLKAHPQPENEDCCTEEFFREDDPAKGLILGNFPELERYFTRDTLEQEETAELLGALYPQEPELVISIWKWLLNRMEDRLGDPREAEYLLFDIMELVWLGDTPPGFLLRQLQQDDCFARRVFGSAWVGYPQEDLLEACSVYSGPVLRQHLQGILDQNPAFHGFD